MIDTRILADIDLFRTLSAEMVARLSPEVELIAFPAQTLLFCQGEQPVALFALYSGRVKLYRESRNKCQILALPMPGECFGAESLPNNSPNPYSAATLTDATCFHLTTDTLLMLLEESPAFQEAFLKLITGRLKQFVTLVHDLAFRDVSSRVAMVLVHRAEQEGQPTEQGIYFERLLSQQEFAAIVGTAREVLYRTFKRFEAAGLIALSPGGITIRDLEALSQIAAQEAR